MRACPCCCTACDRGYIRDAVFDDDTQRLVPVDYLCDCRKPDAKQCANCRYCSSLTRFCED
ncbi:hypothetical protein ACFYZ9_33690 [Streptomyces sp. NPDC001691]|uniref:hypothetical protein n=1 Tax=Streptomyces sp. NPDC001691 TaxID=3364600 RepID=UPI0036C9B3A8